MKPDKKSDEILIHNIKSFDDTFGEQCKNKQATTLF